MYLVKSLVHDTCTFNKPTFDFEGYQMNFSLPGCRFTNMNNAFLHICDIPNP